jgi:hypothetical protein
LGVCARARVRLIFFMNVEYMWKLVNP